MRRLFTLIAAGALVLGTAGVATAGIFPATASLTVKIGTLPQAGFSGSSTAASSAGPGGAATLPAGSISGVFSTAINPPLLGLLDGIGVGASGGWPGGPATNAPLAWNGASGTMSLNGSAYLLMGGVSALEIPLGVVGAGGTQMFHALTLVAGTIFANPYQLGMVTLMGALNTAAHTNIGTGVDSRNPDGSGQLVLVSPTNVSLGPLGSLAAIATLTIDYTSVVPEAGTLLLLGTGIAGLVAIGRRRS